MVEADLLLHVVDVSHPDHEEQIATVRQTLDDIGAADKPTLMVYNKIDRLEVVPVHGGEEEAIYISAVRRIHLEELRELLYNHVSTIHAVRYPYNNFLY